MKTPIERILEAVEYHRAVVVVGTGVSITATRGAQCASWRGLLENGAALCRRENWWNAKDVAACTALLETGADNLPLAAQMIKMGIGKGGNSAYRDWLQDAIGALQVADDSIPRGLHDLDAPLITLNYDRLLELSCPRRLDPITWKDEYHCLRFLRGDERDKVLHLHGYYDVAESVVLDLTSYANLLNSPVVEEFRNALHLTWTMIYVGCGGTFEDPHFEVFRRWVADVLKGLSASHYRLVLESELSDARRLHENDGIVPLAYGREYADLAPFLASLKPKRAAAKSTRSAIPARPHLAARPVLFGRDEKLGALVAALLADAPRPICISGPPGFGKSVLALSALYDPRVEARFGPRRFFVRADVAKSLGDMASAVATAMGIPPDASVSPESTVLDALAVVPTVLVIDNLETVWEPEHQRRNVEDWLGQVSGIKGVVLLVTIRGAELPGHLGWQTPSGSLTPLDYHNAKQVFVAIDPDHVDDPDLPDLLQQLDGWPLALVLMAHQSRGESSLQSVLQRWHGERTRMLNRGMAADAASSLDVSLRVSIESPRMTQGAKRLLQMLGHLPAGLADGAYAEIGCQSTDARRLIELGIAVRERGRLRLLPMIREHVRANHPSSPADFAALRRFYLQLCAEQGPKIGTTHGGPAVERLTAETPNIDLLLSDAAPADELIAGALRGWAAFVEFTGFGDANSLMVRLLEARGASSVKEQADMILAAGRLARARCDYDSARAHYERARALYKTAGEISGEANCIYRLGAVALGRSDHDAALGLYQGALSLFEQVGDLLGEANCISGLGDVALAQSDHDAARGHYEQGRVLYQQVGDGIGEANCIKSLGDIARARGDYAAARTLCEQARPLYKRVGELIGEANCIKSLGDIAFSQSEHSSARSLFEQARPLYQQVGAAIGEANCVKSLGDIALAHSDHDTARAFYEQARPLYQRVGAGIGEVNCIKSLGDIALALSDHEAARTLYEQARLRYQKVGAVLGEANCIFRLGEIALARSDRDTARKLYEQARPLYQAIGDVLGEVNCISGLGDIAVAAEDLNAARALYEQARPLYQRAGAVVGEANCIKSLGDIASTQSQHDAARVLYDQARLLYHRVGAVIGEANCIQSLGDIRSAFGDYDGAAALHDQALVLHRGVGNAHGEANCISGLGDIAKARGDAGRAAECYAAALAIYERIGERHSMAEVLQRLAEVSGGTAGAPSDGLTLQES